MITVKLKSRITCLHRVPLGYFLKIDKGGRTLPISAHEMAPMHTFSNLQKWPKIAKMNQNDLLTLEMVFTEPLRKTEQNTLFVSSNAIFLSI